MDMMGQEDVFGHYAYMFSMYGTQVCILQETC